MVKALSFGSGIKEFWVRRSCGRTDIRTLSMCMTSVRTRSVLYGNGLVEGITLKNYIKEKGFRKGKTISISIQMVTGPGGTQSSYYHRILSLSIIISKDGKVKSDGFRHCPCDDQLHKDDRWVGSVHYISGARRGRVVDRRAIFIHQCSSHDVRAEHIPFDNYGVGRVEASSGKLRLRQKVRISVQSWRCIIMKCTQKIRTPLSGLCVSSYGSEKIACEPDGDLLLWSGNRE